MPLTSLTQGLSVFRPKMWEGEFLIARSLTLKTLTFVGKFAHKCHLLLWVNSPTPLSIMLHLKAMGDSVNYK